MDGVSAAASVVGILVAAVHSVRALTQTIERINKAPEEVQDAQRDLKALAPIFHQLDLHLGAVGEHQPGNTMMLTMRSATDSCRAACDEFQALLIRWLKHSTQDQMFWYDRWRIGLFGASRTKAFRERLADHKGTLALALHLETSMRTIQRGVITEDEKRTMLRVLEKEAWKEIERAELEARDVEARRQLVLFDGGSSLSGQGSEGEMSELRRDLKQDFELLGEANRQLQAACKEALKKAGAARATQKLQGVKATNDSTALAGYINTDDLGKLDQDIRDVTADQRSVAIAGVAKDVDFSSLFFRR